MADTLTRELALTELKFLRGAKPTSIASFETQRAARIEELEAALAEMPTGMFVNGAPVDHALEALLARTQGGDRFGR